jgi:hypothetical protein
MNGLLGRCELAQRSENRNGPVGQKKLNLHQVTSSKTHAPGSSASRAGDDIFRASTYCSKVKLTGSSGVIERKQKVLALEERKKTCCNQTLNKNNEEP